MDNLFEGVIALVSGMSIVFIVLILMAFVMYLFKFIKQPQKKEVVVPQAAPVQAEPEEETDDLELVAVITAAIAASLNTTTDKLQVKSFRRIGSNRSRW